MDKVEDSMEGLWRGGKKLRGGEVGRKGECLNGEAQPTQV